MADTRNQPMRRTISRRKLSKVCLLFAVLCAVAPIAIAQDEPLLRSTVEERIVEHFDRREYERAAAILERYLGRKPDDASMHYNLACAYSRLDRPDDAAAALLDAVRCGFVEFDHMREDPDLFAIHDHLTFQAIVEAAERASARRGPVAREVARSAVDRWRTKYGETDYRYDEDRQHNLTFATALDEQSHREMRAMLASQAGHLAKTFFGAPPGYQVLVAVPTPRHADELLEADNVGGAYFHDSRQLISRNIGSSLRHEFFHLMHYGHMEKLRQRHPLWMQEGLASLYEDYTIDDDGNVTYSTNDRHNIVKRRQSAGRLTKWSELFELSAERFMDRAGNLYPEVRSIFEFVASTGKLPEWYHTYVEQYGEDPSGASAFERVFGKPLPEIERDWHLWIRSQPFVDARVDYGDASMGIRSDENGSNDGVLVTDVVAGYGAARAGVRRGDVIVAVGGNAVRSLKDLIIELGRFKVGDVVAVRLRRDGQYRNVEVQLKALGSR